MSLLPRFRLGSWRRNADRLPVLESLPDVGRSLGVEEASRRFLLYVVLPLWQGAGLLDWWQHRRTRIEHTAGTRESAIHMLMLAEAGVPALAGLFFEVNAGTLALTAGALAAHELTAIWDVAYAEPRRRVSPAEQHVHSMLEALPMMATAFLFVLHWDQALSLFGLGSEPARFRLTTKRRPLSGRYLAGLLTSLALFMGLPYLEELWRCLRANPSLAAQPVPEQPETQTLRIADDGRMASPPPAHEAAD